MRLHFPTRPRQTLRLLLGALLALLLTPQAASAWWNSEWTLRKPITVDLGANAGAVPGMAGRAQVLVRLSAGNFNFLAAKDDGSDLRIIAEDDKTPLNFHIEKFDNLFEMGLVWVDLPNATADKPQTIWLYWGNDKAVGTGNAKAGYDASQALVWHFTGARGPAARHHGLRQQRGAVDRGQGRRLLHRRRHRLRRQRHGDAAGDAQSGGAARRRLHLVGLGQARHAAAQRRDLREGGRGRPDPVRRPRHRPRPGARPSSASTPAPGRSASPPRPRWPPGPGPISPSPSPPGR